MPTVDGKIKLADHDKAVIDTPLGQVIITEIPACGRRKPQLRVSYWNNEHVEVEADVDKTDRIGRHGFTSLVATNRRNY